ncbi:hypothetical protein OBBRIDRAFT_742583, partial [Obba rivulosa]
IFLHTCNAPNKVVKALAHMGISISPDAINNAIISLSNESASNLKELGTTLTASVALDNFNIFLKTATPTVDKSTDHLLHLTSGLLLQIGHGVTKNDLRCSRELWEKSRLNPSIIHTALLQYGFEHLIDLHPDNNTTSPLTRRGRFNAWQFLHDLVTHGPAYFHQFRSHLQSPEDIDCIPVTKLHYLPAKSMDINQSRGNIEAITNLLRQGGMGDPKEDGDDVQDISDYVVLIHGDLGTCERVKSILRIRAIEATPLW